MELIERVERLEAKVDKLNDTATDIDKRLVRLETRSESFATKADLSEATVTHIKWMIGTAIALVGITLAAITFSTNSLLKALPTQTVAASTQSSTTAGQPVSK